MSTGNTKIHQKDHTPKFLSSLFFVLVGFLIFTPFTGLRAESATIYDSLFTVTVETKTEEHPYFGMGNSQGFAIDGVQGAELTLKRGMTYAFRMDNVPVFHPFYISTSDLGAGTGQYTDGVVGSGATGNDTLFFTPGSDAPDMLYYQCQNHQYMGYQINIEGGAMSQGSFVARLSGSSEVPPVATTGSGMVMATLDGDSLFVSGTFQNLASDYNSAIQGGAHLHIGYAGSNGSISIPLNATLNGDNRSGSFDEMDNRFELTSSQVMALEERQFYVNIHTMDNPAGEIRGQIVSESDAVFEAIATGSNKVNTVNTMAHGAVIGEIHGDSLIITGSFNGLTDGYTASHLHLGLAGTTGGVEIPLTASTSSDMNTGVYTADNNRFELSTDQMDMLINRQLYLNIHSNGYPGGEIRGQLVPRSDAYFEANLSGAAEMPSVTSSGHGNIFLELLGDSLFVSGSFTGLSSTYQASHLHMALAGQNGNVEIPLTATTDSDLSGHYAVEDNIYELTEEQKAALQERRMYVNVHSALHAPGELRGQVAPLSNLYFQTSLSGMNEVQPDTSVGMGGLLVELSGTRITVSGTFSDLGSDFATNIAGGSHLHIAGPDANGGIAIPLDAQTEADMRSGSWMAMNNMYTVSQDTAAMLMSGLFYANVHSAMYNAGELRGQVLLSPNFPPDSTMITNHQNGDTVMVEGSGSTEFNVLWDSADDPNDDQVAYIFQLAGSPDFESNMLMINMNVGTSTEYTADFATLASMLENMGIVVGGSADLYARIISSDGSNQTEGSVLNLVMKRGTVTAVNNESADLPDSYALLHNYPNPFNPTTTIPYHLPEESHVTLAVYNMLGQRIRTLINGIKPAGRYSVQWNGLNDSGNRVSTGIYFYRIQAGDFTDVEKMVFMK